MRAKWMRNTCLWTALLPGTALACFAQAPAAGNASNQIQIEPGMVLLADLPTKFDAHKVRPGDLFAANLDEAFRGEQKFRVSHGARIMGRVVSIQLRRRENSESTVVINFEKIVLASGTEVPLRAVITQLRPPVNNPATPTPATSDVGTRGGSYHAQTNIPLSNDRLEKESRDPFGAIDRPPAKSTAAWPPRSQQQDKDDLEIQITGVETTLISPKRDVKLEPHSRLSLTVVRLGE